MDERFCLDAERPVDTSSPPSKKKIFIFPKSNRLLRSRQFKRVSKYGHGFCGKYLFIQVCQSSKSSLKIGLTVSKKYGKAYKRNRFKRIVREAFRLSKQELPAQIHLNVLPKKEFENASLEEIKNELVYLCATASVRERM